MSRGEESQVKIIIKTVLIGAERLPCWKCRWKTQTNLNNSIHVTILDATYFIPMPPFFTNTVLGAVFFIRVYIVWK